MGVLATFTPTSTVYSVRTYVRHAEPKSVLLEVGLGPGLQGTPEWHSRTMEIGTPLALFLRWALL